MKRLFQGGTLSTLSTLLLIQGVSTELLLSCLVGCLSVCLFEGQICVETTPQKLPWVELFRFSIFLLWVYLWSNMHLYLVQPATASIWWNSWKPPTPSWFVSQEPPSRTIGQQFSLSKIIMIPDMMEFLVGIYWARSSCCRWSKVVTWHWRVLRCSGEGRDLRRRDRRLATRSGSPKPCGLYVLNKKYKCKYKYRDN